MSDAIDRYRNGTLQRDTGARARIPAMGHSPKCAPAWASLIR